MGKRGNGEGSISRRKGGGWMAQYVVHTTEGRRRRTIYGKTRKEVARKLAKALSDLEGGLVFDDKGLTVGEYLEHWICDYLEPLVLAGKMAHSSHVRYAGIVENHLKPMIGHKKLKDLSRPEVRRLYNKKARGLSPRSVDYIHVTLQKALSQAVRDDLIPRNVAGGERPRSSRDREEAKALSPEQVKALLGAAGGGRNEALYIVAVHTGLRQGELLGLKWCDIDLDSHKLSVRRSLKVTGYGLGFGAPKNKASRRSIPLNRTAAAALKAHRPRQNEERLAEARWQDQDLVFPNRLGGPTDHNNLYYREYKPLLKRAGLGGEGFTFHALRHTFATALLSKGEHPKVVQSLLGHSSITQTMDTYSHLMEGIGGDAVDGLDEAFG
ncbi:MAG: tyrosine-type recombinase/integrase [Rubrobacteraceae bacterium]